MLLRTRYKNTKDLWLYMTELCKYPTQVACRQGKQLPWLR